MQNNLILPGPDGLMKSDSTSTTDIADVNALDGECVDKDLGTCVLDSDTARIDANVTTSDALDTIFVVVGDDWALKTSTAPTEAKTGGKATTNADCGTHEMPRACGDVTEDIDGTTRTVPPSIGAYERD